MKLEHGYCIVTGEDFPETVKRAVDASVGHYHAGRLPGVQGYWTDKVQDTITDLRAGFGFGRSLDGSMARPNGTATLYMRPAEEVVPMLEAYRDHTLTDQEQIPSGVGVTEERLAVDSLLQRAGEIIQQS